MSQAAREAVLQRFRDGRVMCLIATDVAARGLDISNVDLVVHYELPRDHESFLHRPAPLPRTAGCPCSSPQCLPSLSRAGSSIAAQPSADPVGLPDGARVLQVRAHRQGRQDGHGHCHVHTGRDQAVPSDHQDVQGAALAALDSLSSQQAASQAPPDVATSNASLLQACQQMALSQHRACSCPRHSVPAALAPRSAAPALQVPNLQIIGPPGPQEVMAASAKQVMRRLDNIDPQVKAFFQPAASAVLSNADPQVAMSAALAALSGILEVPKERRRAPPRGPHVANVLLSGMR